MIKFNAQKAFYKLGANFIVDSQRFKKVLRLFLNYAKAPENFLDIGCGNGNFSLKIKEIFSNVNLFRVDISNDIQICKNKGIQAYTVDVSEEKLPFKNDFF